jgi:hypothetical protein
MLKLLFYADLALRGSEEPEKLNLFIYEGELEIRSQIEVTAVI